MEERQLQRGFGDVGGRQEPGRLVATARHTAW
jgi:hypothetical protein